MDKDLEDLYKQIELLERNSDLLSKNNSNEQDFTEIKLGT